MSELFRAMSRLHAYCVTADPQYLDLPEAEMAHELSDWKGDNVNNDIPCRVSADLRRYMEEQSKREPVPFDEHDDAIMHDVMGNERLAKPVQALLMTLRQINTAEASFGVNAVRALEMLLPDLRKLREACEDEWRSM